jgi:hypothetical protein
MRSDVRDVLRRRLGADVRAMDILSDDELARLYEALSTARAKQAAAIAAASDEALRQMPAPLRRVLDRFVRH